MKLKNKFVVTKIAKTQTKVFKDLVVGQTVSISVDLKPHMGASGGNGHYAPKIRLDRETIYLTTLAQMLKIGFEFERNDL